MQPSHLIQRLFLWASLGRSLATECLILTGPRSLWLSVGHGVSDGLKWYKSCLLCKNCVCDSPLNPQASPCSQFLSGLWSIFGPCYLLSCPWSGQLYIPGILKPCRCLSDAKWYRMCLDQLTWCGYDKVLTSDNLGMTVQTLKTRQTEICAWESGRNGESFLKINDC